VLKAHKVAKALKAQAEF
jgi:hypothetical protein